MAGGLVKTVSGINESGLILEVVSHKNDLPGQVLLYTHTQTHTHIYIWCVYVCIYYILERIYLKIDQCM